MQQGASLRGAEFYQERLARARALPEAERPADVRQWLRLHGELEVALAELPGFPATATPERPLVEPLGGDTALAALLRVIAAAYSDSAADPLHPDATLGRLIPQLPPFYRAWREAGNQVPDFDANCIFVQPAFTTHARAGTEASDTHPQRAWIGNLLSAVYRGS